MENHGIKVIHLTGAEEQSGYDRLTFAEDLVRQLPENHEGRNSWILNYSNREDANKMRDDRGIKWDAYHQAAETSKQHRNENSTEMKTKFVKETDRKGTYIIEGSSDGKFFNIKRFICQVQKQETEKETQELADFILSKLNS